MKILQLILWQIALASVVLAQANNSARSDGFQDLVFTNTTSRDAIELLGQPATDKVENLDVSKLGKWLDAKHKEKIFRHLTFKKVRDFRTIKLAFLDDKLVLIELEFAKNVKPERLNGIFGVDFAIVGGPASLPDQLGQYSRPFYATHFPDLFTLVGISKTTFFWANCIASHGVPATIEQVRLVSRSLEKK